MRVIRNSLALATIALLTGCGGGGSSGGGGGGNTGVGGSGTGTGGPDTLQVLGFLGGVHNADLTITDLSATTIGSGNMGNNGQASVANLPAGPKVVTLSGNGQTYYWDAAGCGFGKAIKSGESFHAMVPAATTLVNVSMFSEMAYQWAVANGGVTEANITLANEKIRAAFTPELKDLLHGSDQTATMTGASGQPEPNRPCMNNRLAKTSASIDSTEGQNIAAYLYFSAYPMLGSNVNRYTGRPMVDIAQQLSQDIVDGVIDGTMNGAAIFTNYAPTTITSSVTSHVNKLTSPGLPAGWDWNANPLLNTLP